MKATPTSIFGSLLIEPHVFQDARGFFLETWNRQAYAEIGLDFDFVQDNHSQSGRGTLRGVHYQMRHPQGKLVWVNRGEVFDVIVDLRRSSPTFGCWEGFLLSEQNRSRLWVPPGCAHGFYVTSESAEFLYKCTDYYSPGEDERILLWNDPQLGIQWPIPEGGAPLLSARDARGTPFAQADTYSDLV